MRTLFVLHDAPYPPRSGSPLRFWQLINVMARFGDVSVFSIGYVEPDATKPPLVKDWMHVKPSEFRVDKPPSRFLSRLRRLRRILQPHQFPYVDFSATPALNKRLRSFMEAVQPDTVILSHWLQALPEALERHPRLIVDAHNIESALLADAPLRRNRVLGGLENWAFRVRERRMFNSAARVWLTSVEDATLFRRLVPNARSPHVIPNAIDVRSYADTRKQNAGRRELNRSETRTVGFVGLYAYPPNSQAAELLIDLIFPVIAASLSSADCGLLLVGKEPTSRMLEAANADPRILVTGLVPDVRPYLASMDVFVVPLFAGGGTRMKILEAFAAGIPVVSTSKGAEGINAVEGLEILIAETPGELAEAALMLLRDPVRGQAQAARALRLVNNRYSWDALGLLINDAIPTD